MTTHSKPICKSHERHSKQNLQIRLLLLPTNNLQTFILTIFIVFGLTSCENEDKTITDQLTTAVDTTLKVMSNQEVEQTIIMRDDMELYYADRSNFLVKLLQTGTFNEGAVWENADKEKWFGIFKNDTGFYISDTKIITKKVHDFIGDSEYEEGWLVLTTNKDSAIILINGLGFLNDRKIKQADLSQDLIIPGDTLKFNYLGVDYKMYATGEKIMEGEYSSNFTNHALFLTANKNGQIITEFLRVHAYSNMQHINFAGDIDGDGFIDLIISSETFGDICSRYLFTTLYLSKHSDNGHLLKLVGCGDF